MQPLVDSIKRRGQSPDALLGRYGLSEAMLADPCREIPLRQYVEAFEGAAAHFGDPNFGLFAARDISPFTLGPIGLLFISSPTIGTALKGFIDYIGLAQQATTSRIAQDGPTCVFHYRIEDARIRRRRQDADYSLAMVTTLMRAMAGNSWRPLEVHFEHSAPLNRQAHDGFFGAPLYFDQGVNSLIFPASDLAIAGNLMDRRVSPIVEQYLRTLLERAMPVRSMEDEVRRILSDHRPEDGAVGVHKAARAVGVSARTLQRALQKSGESFGAIKQDKRRTMAETYLADTDLSVTEIAHILGYADGACFTRACRRWFGQTPSAYRKDARGRGTAP
jgi:AraC-like DNA-binding protein